MRVAGRGQQMETQAPPNPGHPRRRGMQMCLPSLPPGGPSSPPGEMGGMYLKLCTGTLHSGHKLVATYQTDEEAWAGRETQEEIHQQRHIAQCNAPPLERNA